jgi:hypothetical protein
MSAVPAETTKSAGQRMSQIIVTAIVAVKTIRPLLAPLQSGLPLRQVFPEVCESHSFDQGPQKNDPGCARQGVEVERIVRKPESP